MDKIRDCTNYVQTFADYRIKNPVWGSLYCVLENHNLDDEAVSYCKDKAEMEQDHYGAELADILLAMSKTQRYKVARLAEKIADHSELDERSNKVLESFLSRSKVVESGLK